MHLTSILGGVLAASCCLLVSSAAQDAPEARKFTNVQWANLTNIDFHPQHAQEAIEIVFDHFVPAGRASGGPQPRILEYAASGAWDLTIVFPMPEGPRELEWEMSPTSIKWYDALAKLEGGADAAAALMDRYLSLVRRYETHIVRERIRPTGSRDNE